MSTHTVIAAALITGLALAGCTVASPAPQPGTPSDCGAAALQDNIGQPVTGETASDVRVGGEPVQSRGNVRVVDPGDVVTMDFNTERLTLRTDAARNLVAARCE